LTTPRETFDRLEEAIVLTRLAMAHLGAVAGRPLHELQDGGIVETGPREPAPLSIEDATMLFEGLERVSRTLSNVQKGIRTILRGESL
jgi:hypothetical protein